MCCILQLYNQYSFASSHLLTTVSRYVEFYCEPYCVGVIVGLSRVANDKRKDMIPRSRWYRDIRVSRRDRDVGVTVLRQDQDFQKRLETVSRLRHSRRRLQPWFLVILFHCVLLVCCVSAYCEFLVVCGVFAILSFCVMCFAGARHASDRARTDTRQRDGL